MANSPNQAENDIYTVLLIVATFFVLFGTIIVAIRSNELFGSWMPF